MDKKNNDFEVVSERFNNENITAPPSLDETAIKEKLGSGKVIRLKKKTPWYKAAVAIAACFAVVAVSVTLIYNSGGNKGFIESPVASDESFEGIKTYKSYEELSNDIVAMEPEYYMLKDYAVAEDALGSEVKSNAAADVQGKGSGTATTSSINEATPDSTESFAETNKQTDAVDEADIIKTDGKYIYYVPDVHDRIYIYFADGENAKRVTEVIPEESGLTYSEMYIYGDKLIAVGTKRDFEDKTQDVDGEIFYNSFMSACNSFVYIYDISDATKPVLSDMYEQSGYYNSSRMIGSCIYLISDFSRYDYYIKNDGGKEFVPCATNTDGLTEKLAINDICSVEDTRNQRYSVIGAMDVEKGHKSNQTKAILGANEQIYCSENNLYLTGTMPEIRGDWDSGEVTRIVKYSLNKTKIKPVATGKAKGSVNDQFSLDEYKGRLRVALTDYRWNDEGDRNYLYVLNDKLEIIGQTEDFAKGEHIEAVRFMGDTAYVITYEQTDPLFVMDLSDPKNPRITGKVKIDGFSSFLTPVDDNTMLGIGFSTKTEEWGIVQDGLKLALFDVSDKNNPEVLDELEFHDSYSEAQYSHKALTVNREQGYFAIPFEAYYETVKADGEEYKTGALIIRIEDGKLSVENRETKVDINRTTYVGKMLYAPTTDGQKIYSFEIK